MKNRATLLFILSLILSFDVAAQFTTVTNLNLLEAQAFATREKQQAKVFAYEGKHWAILANTNGTHLWRLDGITWQHVLKLVTRNSFADYVIDGDFVHILLYSGTSSQFISIEYDKASSTFKHVHGENSAVEINLEAGVMLASMDMDKTGRIWVASNGSSGKINVRWSDTPYKIWSSPITIASGVREDDLCAVVSIPQTNSLGVLWSNQSTKKWGFKIHKNNDNPSIWSEDEVPASQSAINIGSGISDDHMNIKVGSDGTLYCAIKTGYNKKGYPLIGLLVRRPSGKWDNLYEVSQSGTLPIILLNEKIGMIRVIYTSMTYGGDIVYKESLISNISFCKQYMLMSGHYNYVTSIKHDYVDDVVILASNATHVVGVLATDSPTPPNTPLACDLNEEETALTFKAFPNPFSLSATVSFLLPEDEEYTLSLYDSKGAKITVINEGFAVAGELNNLEIDGSSLTRGLYLVKLQTKKSIKSLKLVFSK